MEQVMGMLSRPNVQAVVSEYFALEESGCAVIGDEAGSGCVLLL